MNNISQYETVLLVDDDPVISTLVSKLFRKTGYFHKLWRFTNGLEALYYMGHLMTLQKEYYHKKPILIILDLNMPDFNGYEFLEMFDELEQSVKERFKIIVLSSSEDHEDVHRINVNQNVQGYIIKPKNIETIDSIDKFFVFAR
ncbi:response regulator [Belliella kenyensis]|uniref:Response regulator n=1 Tax=Belliella kenyensis TaxID=1472724 RepID=A0ABV8EK46_9BACT|nr:response regulator [Belliella kenyensis]MCH7403509.1 response regulator [Belliella kenyensis]MDN3604969.1 response regulator [Belliella kenyensis]